MKSKFFIPLTLGLAMTGVATSCSDDDDDDKDQSSDEIISKIDAADDLEYNSSNSENWNQYLKVISSYLKTDATTLYTDWTSSYEGGDSYADQFKNAGNEGSPFSSAEDATLQIIDGCVDIANEVGESKIGEPYQLWKDKKYESALYSVESWYSWHSRDDYSNNIRSIRNAYLGSLDGSVAENSISAIVKSKNADFDAEVLAAINKAIDAIQAIPQPFRNHIGSSEASEAMDACAALKELLEKDLKAEITNDKFSEETLAAVNANYVDNVVVPTYKSLKEANDALATAVNTFAASASNDGFESLANAWYASREYWEKSEAFLFGPVSDKGLDPNMDSWPLDQTSIKAILTKGDFSALGWDGDYDEESESIEAAQSIRGFHTLEYLVFKAGKPRTISK